MVKIKNKKGGQAAAPMEEEHSAPPPPPPPPPAVVPMEPLTDNPPSSHFATCLTYFQDPPPHPHTLHLKKAIIQFMVADSKHDMNFTLKDYDKIFAALMLLPDFPQEIYGQSIENYINNASSPENLHTRLLRIINQYTEMPQNAGVNVLKELDEDSQIHSYSPDLYRILNDKSTSVEFEKVNIHGNNWLFQKYVMRNSQRVFNPGHVLASIRDLHGPPLIHVGSDTQEYRLLLSLDDATFLSKIKQNIDSLNLQARARSSASIQEVYTLNVLLLHENLMDPGSSFNPSDDRIAASGDDPRIFINMIRPDQAGNIITINGINITINGSTLHDYIGDASPWVYQQGYKTYRNGFFSRATVTASEITKNGNNYSSDITITAPSQPTITAPSQPATGAAGQPAAQIQPNINYQYTATTGADPTSNCRKFLKTMLTSIATVCMSHLASERRTHSIYDLLMKDSLLMQSKRMGDTGLGLIFLRLKQQLGDTVFNQLGKPVCSTIDRLAALSYNMMGINYMFFMRGGDQLEYYTCIREANIQTPEEREKIYEIKLIELKQKIIEKYGDLDIIPLLEHTQKRLGENFTEIRINPGEELRIDINFSGSEQLSALKKQLYKIYIKRKKERFFDSISNKQTKINREIDRLRIFMDITNELLFEIYSLIYEVLNFNVNSFINPQGSEENYSMFLEIENAYYYPYIPRRRGRSMSRPVREQVNISDFSTIKLLFDKLNIDQQTYNDYLSGYAQRTKLQQYYNATIMGQHIHYQGAQGAQGAQSGGKPTSAVVPPYPTEEKLIYLINYNYEQFLRLDTLDYNSIMNIIYRIINIITRNREFNSKKELYLDIKNIIENAIFELKKYVEMNEFRIKKFEHNEEECGYCNKKLNQYLLERDSVKEMIDELSKITRTNIVFINLSPPIHEKPDMQPRAGPMDGAAAEDETNKIEELKTYIQKDISDIIREQQRREQQRIEQQIIEQQRRRQQQRIEQQQRRERQRREQQRRIKQQRREAPHKRRTSGLHSTKYNIINRRSSTPYRGGKRKTKNKNNKRKTIKSKNKLRKTQKKKNRQDKKRNPNITTIY